MATLDLPLERSGLVPLEDGKSKLLSISLRASLGHVWL